MFSRFVQRIHGGLRQRHRDDQRNHRWSADSVAIQGTTARAFVELVQTRAGRVGGAFIFITFVFPYFVFRIYFRMGYCTDVVFCEQGPDGYATHVRAMQMAARSIHDVLNDTLDLHKYVLTGKISMTPRQFDFLRAAFETVEEGESLFNELLFPYGYGQLD